jgi:predicted DNA binding CopG/RHH family protein
MEEKRRGKGRGRPPRARELKDQRIAIRLSNSDLELINKLSVEEDLPVAQIIRKAVKLYSNYYNPPY